MNLLVFGFGFTGSGAVVDWLHDSPHVRVSPKIKGFMGRHGIGEILLAQGETDRQRQLVMARIAWLDRQIEHRPLKTRIPGYRRGRRVVNAARTMLGLGRRTGEHMTNTEVEGVEGWRLDRAYLVDFLTRLDADQQFDQAGFWQSWLAARVRQYCGDAQRVALDKCIDFSNPQYDGAWERVFDPARLIAVHRDPADHLAELGLRVGWEKLAGKEKYVISGSADLAEGFLRRTQENLERLLAYHQGAPGICLPVPFEDFVLDHTRWAGRIAQWLEFPDGKTVHSRFDPAVSRRNIGIGRSDERVQELFAPHRKRVEAIRELRRELGAAGLSE